MRIRPSARGTSFGGIEGVIVSAVGDDVLVQLDGETRPLRFGRALVEVVDHVRWCEPCPDTVPAGACSEPSMTGAE